MKSIKLAAVQVLSSNQAPALNMQAAEPLIAQASATGAELILLPEFFAIGYELNENLWLSAEPINGPTEQWLCHQAQQHQCHIGGSYLQAKGSDFINYFALAAPNGEIVGRIPKRHPGYVEPYFYRGEESSQIIDTELGRIGVAICYDSCFRATAEAMIAGNADIMLIPLSGPTPQKRWYYSQKKMAAYNDTYRHAASKYSALLGIPAVMANKCGPWQTTLPGWLPAEDSWFYGQSEISDSDGSSLQEKDDQPGVVCAEVVLNPARKTTQMPASSAQYGPWIGPVPSEFKLLWLFEWFGKRSYANSPRRIAAARQLSQTGG